MSSSSKNIFLCFVGMVACLILTVSAQSVAEECLTEQIRNSVNIQQQQQQQQTTPEAITMAGFDAICQNFNRYVDCFENRLPDADTPADQFLQLVFRGENMRAAYTGLCSLDLEVVRANARCLLSTPQVRRCYTAFNQGVSQIVRVLEQETLPRATLEELACNTSVTRYRCETAVYTFCNAQVGRAMQDLFHAGVTDECRETTGVTSRYTALFAGGNSISVQSYTFHCLLAVLVLILQCFWLS